MPPEGSTFNKNDEASWHYPFSSDHMKIKGVTHSNVRYFAKKHWKLVDDPLLILGFMKFCYPLLIKYFNPDLRKLFDIAYRERK